MQGSVRLHNAEHGPPRARRAHHLRDASVEQAKQAEALLAGAYAHERRVGLLAEDAEGVEGAWVEQQVPGGGVLGA